MDVITALIPCGGPIGVKRRWTDDNNDYRYVFSRDVAPLDCLSCYRFRRELSNL